MVAFWAMQHLSGLKALSALAFSTSQLLFRPVRFADAFGE
jgi:hypothetical protein